MASRQWILARYPDFRRLFAGTAISQLGSSVTTVALPLTAVVYLRASPAEMGFLGAATLLPHLLLGLPAGVWVSRLSYKWTLVTVDLARVPLLGSVPVLAAFGVLQAWHLYLVALLAGVASLFESVTSQSLIPAIIPRDQLLPANSLLMLANATTSTTGPALGGLLVSLLTAPIAMVADAVSFLLAGLCKMRIRPLRTEAAPASSVKRSLTGEIGEGLRAVFGHGTLRVVTLAATIGAAAGQMQTVVLVLYLVRNLRFSSVLVGVVTAMAGVAAIIGAVVATRVTERVGPGPAFIGGMAVAATAGVVLAAASGPIAVVLAIVVLAQLIRGVAPSIYGVNQQTFRQALVAPSLLPRANATWRFLVYGTQTVGALLGGLFGGAFGLRGTLLIGSGLMFAGAMIAWASPLRSLRAMPGRLAQLPS